MFVEREAILNREGILSPLSFQRNLRPDDQNGKTDELSNSSADFHIVLNRQLINGIANRMRCELFQIVC